MAKKEKEKRGTTYASIYQLKTKEVDGIEEIETDEYGNPIVFNVKTREEKPYISMFYMPLSDFVEMKEEDKKSLPDID